MSGFAKLYSSILSSSIWAEPDHVRITWITLLVSADADGRVMSSIPGLAHFARVQIDKCREAIDRLSARDADSRDQTDEGRRIRPIPGGWQIVSYPRYRAMTATEEVRSYERQRKQQWREENTPSTPPPKTEANAEAEAKGSGTKQGLSRNVPDIALDIYSAYPKKCARANAIKAIVSAIKKCSGEKLLERTVAYRKATEAWDATDKKFIPHPASWFNAESYEDDPETWKRQPNGTHQHHPLPGESRNSKVFTQDYSGV
jgi:hypothetical protein